MGKKNDFRAFFLLFTASVRSRPPGPPVVTGVLLTLTFALSSSIFLLSPLITFHPLWGYPGSSGSYRTIVCSGPYWIRLGTYGT